MRVLLVKPHTAADEIIPPIALGYLAQAIRPDHEPVVLDCLKEQCGIERIRELAPQFDVIGITVFTKDLALCRDYLAAAKSANPRIVTVCGGPHPSAVPDETARYYAGACDYAFIGESEQSFPMLLSHLEAGNPPLQEIPGLCWMEDGAPRSTPCIVRQDLDSFDVAWDLMPPASYPEAPHGAFYKQYPIAPIITSRGCPFHCTFCGGFVVSGRKIRQRSVGHVLDEIALLHDTYGVREIHIEDDNFTFRKDYVLEFCARLRERFPGITWTCPNGVRIDTLDEEMLAAMKASGCYALSLGIESGNNDTLKAMKKSLTVEKTLEKIAMIARSGIMLNAFFILGYPGETPAHIERTIEFACSLPLKRASFANFQPLPGTEAFDDLVKAGELTFDSWEQFRPSLQSTVWCPRGFTTDQLAWYRRKALLSFYLRPRIVWEFVKGINSWHHFLYILKRAVRWLTFSGGKTGSQP